MEDKERKHVLIISDEVDLCMLLKAYCLRKNYRVSIVHTLEQGMQRIAGEVLHHIFLDASVCDNLGETIEAIQKEASGAKLQVIGTRNRPRINPRL